MTQFYQLGGSERLGVELAIALNRQAIHADIVSMYSEGLSTHAMAKEALLQAGIPNVYFLDLNVNPNLVSIIPAALKLRRLIRSQEYDIVETSGITPSFLAAWATQGLRARHVVGIHDVFLRENHSGMKHQIWRLTMQWNRGIRFYAISGYVFDCWIRYSRTKANRTRTVLNSIADQYFTEVADRSGVRKELGLPDNSHLILFVGRLMKRKGIDTLLDSVGPVLNDNNAYLLCIGSEAEQPEGIYSDEVGLMGRLRDSVKTRDWGCRVRFLGLRRDVPRLMAASDLLVHPARIEGFGLVLAEALAAGLPVVASNVHGIPEVLEGTDSLMVPPDDPFRLRQAVIGALSRSTEDVAKVLKTGRLRADKFRTQNRTFSMIQFFDDVLKGHS